MGNLTYNNISKINLVMVSQTKNPPTESDYKKGIMYRYFVSMSNNKNNVFEEVDKNVYDSVKGLKYYKAVKIEWMIRGTKEKVIESNIKILNFYKSRYPKIYELCLRNPDLYLLNE